MIDGKTVFSWNVPEIENGNPNKFTSFLESGLFEGILLKCADGPLVHKPAPWSPWPNWGNNIKPLLVKALREAGFKIYLWHYLYGNDPKGELAVAKKQISSFEPDGYVWNAEGSFDIKPNAEKNAVLLASGIRDEFPDLPQALCWWALPKNPSNPNIEWHPIKVAKAFLPYMDLAMPMMYWQGNTPEKAVDYLLKSLHIWRTYISRDLPINPIGRAYTGDGGFADAKSITAFGNKVLNLADSYGLIGNSWWSLDAAHDVPEVWSALTMLPKFRKEVGKISNEEILSRLVTHHKELFPEIFGGVS